MLQIDNQTPFEVAIAPFPDEQGIDTLYAVVKATFALPSATAGDGLLVAEEQQPVLRADEPWGEPGASSLRYAGELHLAKPATDVVLVGSAQRRDRRPAERLDVRLRVGPVAKTVRVFGDRLWSGGLFGGRPGAPEPFEAMPLTWENAFGGTLTDEDGTPTGGEPRNPVGRGWSGQRSEPPPNLEDPRQLIGGAKDRPAPAGFGFVAPSWQPRAGYAGTYDAAWQRRRAPYLPADFDPRFFNAAAPGLTCRALLAGGEPVELEHASVTGPLRFSLPRCALRVTVAAAGGPVQPPVRLETVLLEPDEDRLVLTWRAAHCCDKQLTRIAAVRFELDRLELGAVRAA
jgi:hypothetical protein